MRSGGISAIEKKPRKGPSVDREVTRKPMLTIESGRRWASLDLRDLWLHRDLFFFLVSRDLKIRYKQTVLGAAWAMLQPLLTMVVFTLFFGKLAKIPSDGIPYPIFAYAGLLPWTFFSNAVTASSNSLVGNAALITKVYFPRTLIPGAAIGAGLVDFAIASIILFAMMLWYGIPLSIGVLLIIPLMILLTGLSMGIGLWTSALNVKYRDVRYALPFLVQIWMYATPIIYPISFVPERWRWVLVLNPLTGIIDGFRAALFRHPIAWSEIGVSAAISFTLLVYSVFSFKRMEREFADII
jgi:lipopolysaccharide transport system permease protein